MNSSVHTGATVLQRLTRLRSYIALILVFAFFALNAPNFLTAASLVLMLKHISITAILAIGMTFVILTGGIDLSVGSIAGLAGMIAGSLILNGLVLAPLDLVIYMDVWMIVLITLLVGAIIGALNGVLIGYFGVAPFIATLGMLYIARSIALLSSEGATFANLVGIEEYGNTGFEWLGSGTLAGIPVPIVLLASIFTIAMVVARHTPLGRQIYALGGSERASILAGIDVKRVKVIVYAVSGVCAALVGLIISSQLVSAHPATGEALELSAIAAVVLGGASLAGGTGTIRGTLVGACVIGILADGMVMMGISEFWQMFIMGIVIVLAVLLDSVQKRMMGAA